MAENMTGGCQCGHIRYEIIGEPEELAVCHCLDCQKQSGSAFGMSMGLDPAQFRLLSGTLKTFDWKTDSGRIKECAFCPGCGSRIYHRGEWGLSLKAGTLDNTDMMAPRIHVWTMRKLSWVAIPEGVKHIPDDG